MLKRRILVYHHDVEKLQEVSMKNKYNYCGKNYYNLFTENGTHGLLSSFKKSEWIFTALGWECQRIKGNFW